MDATASKVVALLQSGDLDLRMAAIRVVTELEISGPTVVRSFGRALREEPQALKTLCLRGLEKLGARDVIHYVIPLLEQPGELRDQALGVVVKVGAPSVEDLKKLYPRTDYNGKRTVATALCRIGTPDAFQFILDILPREAFEIQKHIGQRLCEAIDGLSPERQRPFFAQLKRFLASPKTRKDLQMLVLGLILLGHFHGERQVQAARKLLLSYGEKRQPPEIRRYALIALNRTLQEAPLQKETTLFLERSICDEDWTNVAQHALHAYQRVNDSRAKLSRWIQLLHQTPHEAVVVHLLERLASEDRIEVAKAIVPFLRDSRHRVREAVEKTLGSLNTGIQFLFALQAESDDPDLSHRVHAILMEFPVKVKRQYLKPAIAGFLTLFQGNDARYELFLEFIRAIDPEPLRKAIYERVDVVRRSKTRDRWLKISRFLQVLWDQHLITSEGRYLFAVALTKLNNKDLSPHARTANLGLQVIRSLIYDDTPGLVRRLTRDRELAAEDYFYIGFHFMEEGEEFHPFATALLEYVARKYRKTRIAGFARQKLDQRKEAAVPSRRERRRRPTPRPIALEEDLDQEYGMRDPDGALEEEVFDVTPRKKRRGRQPAEPAGAAAAAVPEGRHAKTQTTKAPDAGPADHDVDTARSARAARSKAAAVSGAKTPGAKGSGGTTSGPKRSPGKTSGVKASRGKTSGAKASRGKTSGAKRSRGKTSGAKASRGKTSGAKPSRRKASGGKTSGAKKPRKRTTGTTSSAKSSKKSPPRKSAANPAKKPSPKQKPRRKK